MSMLNSLLPRLGTKSTSPQPRPRSSGAASASSKPTSKSASPKRTVISRRDVTDTFSDASSDQDPTSDPVAAPSKTDLASQVAEIAEHVAPSATGLHAEDVVGGGATGSGVLDATVTKTSMADMASAAIAATGADDEQPPLDDDAGVELGVKNVVSAKTARKLNAPKSKATKSRTAKEPKTEPSKAAGRDDKSQIEFAGETGPDTSITVDGEVQWEIERIAGSEDDGKILLVKWKGWKGFWEEPRDAIMESAPNLVEEFEKKLQAEKEGKEIGAARKRRGATGERMSVRKALTGKKPAKKEAVEKKEKSVRSKGEEKAKVTKPAATKATGAKKGPKPVSPKSPKRSAAARETKSPAKSPAKATPKKAASSKKATPKKGTAKARPAPSKAKELGAKPAGVSKNKGGRPRKMK